MYVKCEIMISLRNANATNLKPYKAKHQGQTIKCGGQVFTTVNLWTIRYAGNMRLFAPVDTENILNSSGLQILCYKMLNQFL